MKTNINFNSPKRLWFVKYFIVFVMILCINLSPLSADNPPQDVTNTVTNAGNTTQSQDSATTKDSKAGKVVDKGKTQQAQNSTTTEDPKLNKVIDVLFVFLVLSIVFESAMTPIFRWRIWKARFDKKGLKTPVILITALIVFWRFKLDIFGDLVVALDPEKARDAITLPGQIMTAFLIAGGSSGILQILTKLKIRNPDEIEKKEIIAEPEKKKEEKPPEAPQGND